MIRGGSAALLVASLLAGLLFFAGAIGWSVPIAGYGGGGAPETDMRFHGKSAARPVADAVCQSGECHRAYPHEKRGTVAPFLNYHAEFIDCLACHGKAAEENRVGRKDPGGRRVLKWGKTESGGNPHGLLGSAAMCRGCHSETGKRSLAGRGYDEFPQGFESPTALRMIEEKKIQWLPAGLR